MDAQMNKSHSLLRFARNLVAITACGCLANVGTEVLAQQTETVSSSTEQVAANCSASEVRPVVYCKNCQATPDCWLDGRDSDLRRALKDTGITLTNNLTNFYIGNTRGGNEQQFSFAGHGDYLANLNIHKMGGPQGQFLQIRAEHRYGESITPASGALLPPTLATDIPVRDSEQLYITNFLFAQALSESFAVSTKRESK